MTKTQVYLPTDELAQLQQLAKRTGRSLADLIREAIRRIWIAAPATAPIALWTKRTKRTSVDHDTIYDEP